MMEFNYEILCSYLLSGYKYVLYYSLEAGGLILPSKDEPAPGPYSYVLPITDEQVYEMADGVNECQFYVLS